MKEYLDNIKDFDDTDVENALNAYIEYHNTTKKESTEYKPIEIRDLDDPIAIDKILKNILKSFKRHIIKQMKLLMLMKNYYFGAILLKIMIFI